MRRTWIKSTVSDVDVKIEAMVYEVELQEHQRRVLAIRMR
jgi:hypothetical protein